MSELSNLITNAPATRPAPRPRVVPTAASAAPRERVGEGFYDELNPAGDVVLQKAALAQMLDSGIEESLARQMLGLT
jgi:hypothetical protein